MFKKTCMRNFTVSLSEEDAEALSSVAATYPGASVHVIHEAAVRLGLRRAADKPTAMRDELGRILEARRRRRDSKQTRE